MRFSVLVALKYMPPTDREAKADFAIGIFVPLSPQVVEGAKGAFTHCYAIVDAARHDLLAIVPPRGDDTVCKDDTGRVHDVFRDCLLLFLWFLDIPTSRRCFRITLQQNTCVKSLLSIPAR